MRDKKRQKLMKFMWELMRSLSELEEAEHVYRYIPNEINRLRMIEKYDIYNPKYQTALRIFGSEENLNNIINLGENYRMTIESALDS